MTAKQNKEYDAKIGDLFMHKYNHRHWLVIAWNRKNGAFTYISDMKCVVQTVWFKWPAKFWKRIR